MGGAEATGGGQQGFCCTKISVFLCPRLLLLPYLAGTHTAVAAAVRAAVAAEDSMGPAVAAAAGTVSECTRSAAAAAVAKVAAALETAGGTVAAAEAVGSKGLVELNYAIYTHKRPCESYQAYIRTEVAVVEWAEAQVADSKGLVALKSETLSFMNTSRDSQFGQHDVILSKLSTV